MRIGYSDEEQFQGQFALWQSNCARSLQGKPGQAALRELEEALVSLPTKRLIADALVHGGDVCAIGALALKRGKLTLSEEDEGEEMEDIGVGLGMPRLVAWKVVEVNDLDLDYHFVIAPGPDRPHYLGHAPYFGGYRLRVAFTPEERYAHVLAWVRHQLKAA